MTHIHLCGDFSDANSAAEVGLSDGNLVAFVVASTFDEVEA